MLYGAGSGYREVGVEIVTFRVAGIGKRTRPSPRSLLNTEKTNVKSRREVFWPEYGKSVMTKVYDALKTDEILAGPCILELSNTTVLIHPGDRASTDELGNIVIHFKDSG
jgi:N-methylhydantoinase A